VSANELFITSGTKLRIKAAKGKNILTLGLQYLNKILDILTNL
jgi:hypothetical protein